MKIREHTLRITSKELSRISELETWFHLIYHLGAIYVFTVLPFQNLPLDLTIFNWVIIFHQPKLSSVVCAWVHHPLHFYLFAEISILFHEIVSADRNADGATRNEVDNAFDHCLTPRPKVLASFWQSKGGEVSKNWQKDSHSVLLPYSFQRF